MRLVDHALAAAELGFRVIPLHPRSKRPSVKEWPARATTDPNRILEWFRDAPESNYGIATGEDLFVIDLDGQAAADWWDAQDFPQGPTITTPSGGRHVYYASEGVDIQTNASKVHPGVDVRGHNGYVVGPGSILPNGTYTGSLEGLELATDELIAILPERQSYEHTQYEGKQVEAASDSEKRQLAAAVAELEALPRVWAEGAGWRTTAYRVACWLSRMVNSTAYALDEDAAITILLTHTPTDAEWSHPQILAEWASARKTTAGQFADPPVADVPPLLPFIEAANALPEFTSRGETFAALLLRDPEVNTPGMLWGHRKTLLVECFRAGLTAQQAITIAWSAKVSQSLQGEPAGIEKLWAETEKARILVEAEGGAGIEAAPAEERPALTENHARHIDLMPAPERDAARAVQWFGTEYMAWAEESVAVMNAPYHKLNMWTILALVFAPHGVIPLGGGINSPLNAFGMVIGDTTTGKSESMKLMRTVLEAFFNPDTNPNIGGDASPNALIEKLILRDGQSSWFNSDEAHGHIKAMRQGGWLQGLPEKLTDLYDGRVPMMLRNGKKDVSGVDATTYFTMTYAGTMKGLSEALEPSDWQSGFLNRFIWAIGEKAERTRESMKIKLRRDDGTGVNPRHMQKYWAAHFQKSIDAVHRQGTAIKEGGPVEMDITVEVEERHNDLTYNLSVMTDGHKHEEMLKPTFARFSFTVLKFACLVALSMGSRTVTPLHHMIAVEAAEEWAANIITMVNNTTATGFTKQVDDVERFIASQKGRSVRLERVYSHFHIEKYRMDQLVEQLVAEGRITKTRSTDGAYSLSIKEAV